MVPQMKKRGHDVDYAVNITVVSSIIALMIPQPQHDHLFHRGGGAAVHCRSVHCRHPGLLLALLLMAAAWWVAKKKNYPTDPLSPVSR